MGLTVLKVFKQASDPHFKDAFDSDEAVGILLVQKELAAVGPLKCDPAFCKDPEGNSNDGC